MNSTPLTGVERHIDAASKMLQRGVRPTVDLVVAECGGSRTTAQKALAELWENRLPAMLDARSYEEDIPASIRETMGAVWREARQLAEEEAQAVIAQQLKSLDAERAEINGVLAGIAAERQEAAAAIAERDASILSHQHNLRDQEQRLAAAQQENIQLRHEHSALELQLTSTLTQLQTAQADMATLQADAQRAATAAQEALQQAQAEGSSRLQAAQESFEIARSSIVASHQESMDALKAAYHDSDQRLRLEIDGYRTELAKARKEAASAAAAAAEKIDTLRCQVIDLESKLAKASERMVRRPWQKPRNTLPKAPR